MAGNNTEFLSFIKRYGVAKTSHFRLSVTPFQGSGLSMNKLLGLRCEAADLPGRQIISNDSRTYGPSYKTPYQSSYQEITLNFIETAEFLIRGFFELWMDQVYNSGTNLISYPRETCTDVTLTQYDVMLTDEKDPLSSLRAIATWTMYNAFPTAVNQMPVSWTEDALHRTTINLAYEWYSLETGGNALIPKDSLPTTKSSIKEFGPARPQGTP